MKKKCGKRRRRSQGRLGDTQEDDKQDETGTEEMAQWAIYLACYPSMRTRVWAPSAHVINTQVWQWMSTAPVRGRWRGEDPWGLMDSHSSPTNELQVHPPRKSFSEKEESVCVCVGGRCSVMEEDHRCWCLASTHMCTHIHAYTNTHTCGNIKWKDKLTKKKLVLVPATTMVNGHCPFDEI